MQDIYDEVKPNYEEVKITKQQPKSESYFDGKFMEYIGYKLLAFLITAVTLTIAKPWADKLILEYKINHTLYNGKRLKFEGKGSDLFVQRFKWVFFTIITLGIYSLWIPIKKEKWVISNIHFEDEELKQGESFFDGKLIGLIGVNLFTYLLTLVSFGLLFPFAICYKQKWIAKHTVINCKKIVFNGKALSIIGHYIIWWLLSIITFGIYGLWLPMKVYGWEVKNTHIKLKDEEYKKQNILPVLFGILLAILATIGLVSLIVKLDIPKVITGDKKIEDIFEFGSKKSPSEEGQINFNIQGTVKKESECPNGYEYDSVNKYCIKGYYSSITKEQCNALGGQYDLMDCIVIILKPTTTSKDISCVNDYNESDRNKKCYKNVSVKSEEECKDKNGFYYTNASKKWCTVNASNEDLLGSSSSKENNESSKPSTSTPKKTKCNSGYKYDSATNTCYNVNSGMEPTSGCGSNLIEYNSNCFLPESNTSSCDNNESGYFMYKGYCLNEEMASSTSIYCPSGYKLSGFDFDGKNWCYKSAKPNY